MFLKLQQFLSLYSNTSWSWASSALPKFPKLDKLTDKSLLQLPSECKSLQVRQKQPGSSISRAFPFRHLAAHEHILGSPAIPQIQFMGKQAWDMKQSLVSPSALIQIDSLFQAGASASAPFIITEHSFCLAPGTQNHFSFQPRTPGHRVETSFLQVELPKEDLTLTYVTTVDF